MFPKFFCKVTGCLVSFMLLYIKCSPSSTPQGFRDPTYLSSESKKKNNIQILQLAEHTHAWITCLAEFCLHLHSLQLHCRQCGASTMPGASSFQKTLVLVFPKHNFIRIYSSLESLIFLFVFLSFPTKNRLVCLFGGVGVPCKENPLYPPFWDGSSCQ